MKAGVQFATRRLKLTRPPNERLGIERFVRELYKEKAEDVKLLLTTVTYTHTGTLRLQEIEYKIDAIRNGRTYTWYEGSIEVENKRVLPKVGISAIPRISQEELEEIILRKKAPSKK